MLRRPFWVLLPLAACASGPPVTVPDPEPILARAEQALREDRAADALALIAGVEFDGLPRRLRDRHEMIEATGLLLSGEPWDAYLICERFPDRYPHSELRASIAEIEYQAGHVLEKRDGSFLFFYSDRRAARTILEHLITRHPDHGRVPDALRLLGDMAFEDQLYLMAQERYRDLMRRYPDSEWVVYARFRFAMSIVSGLQGPDYDLDQMEHASRELRDFLRGNPENPDFVAQASSSLARLLEWRAERHLRIADFYARVDNPTGHRLHLEYACIEELAATGAGKAARARLDLLADGGDGEAGR